MASERARKPHCRSRSCACKADHVGGVRRRVFEMGPRKQQPARLCRCLHRWNQPRPLRPSPTHLHAKNPVRSGGEEGTSSGGQLNPRRRGARRAAVYWLNRACTHSQPHGPSPPLLARSDDAAVIVAEYDSRGRPRGTRCVRRGRSRVRRGVERAKAQTPDALASGAVCCVPAIYRAVLRAGPAPGLASPVGCHARQLAPRRAGKLVAQGRRRFGTTRHRQVALGVQSQAVVDEPWQQDRKCCARGTFFIARFRILALST